MPHHYFYWDCFLSSCKAKWSWKGFKLGWAEVLTERLYSHVSQQRSNPLLWDLHLHINHVSIKMETLPITWRSFFLVASSIFLSVCCVSSVSGLNFSGHLCLPTFNSCLRVWFWQTDSWHVLGTQGISLGNRLSKKICSTLITFRSEETQQKSMARGFWQLWREPELLQLLKRA